MIDAVSSTWFLAISIGILEWVLLERTIEFEHFDFAIQWIYWVVDNIDWMLKSWNLKTLHGRLL